MPGCRATPGSLAGSSAEKGPKWSVYSVKFVQSLASPTLPPLRRRQESVFRSRLPHLVRQHVGLEGFLIHLLGALNSSSAFFCLSSSGLICSNSLVLRSRLCKSSPVSLVSGWDPRVHSGELGIECIDGLLGFRLLVLRKP